MLSYYRDYALWFRNYFRFGHVGLQRFVLHTLMFELLDKSNNCSSLSKLIGEWRNLRIAVYVIKLFIKIWKQ